MYKKNLLNQQVFVRPNCQSVFMSNSSFHIPYLNHYTPPPPHHPTPADLRELRQVPGGAQRLRQGPAEPDAGYLGFLVSCRHRRPTQHCDAICQEDFIVSLLLIDYRAQTCNVVYNSISQLNSLPPLGWVSSFKGLVVDLEEGNLVKLAEDGTVLR